ncbi:unnamed protein product [Periconia digitata]|uniref:Uncharacterized protein n=1 Tax=Periconia digitata TaxID=1303443 RepID=A0A9W4XR24_9PLEO|nr:unnamed protein product [Periconia digitata]
MSSSVSSAFVFQRTEPLLRQIHSPFMRSLPFPVFRVTMIAFQSLYYLSYHLRSRQQSLTHSINFIVRLAIMTQPHSFFPFGSLTPYLSPVSGFDSR